MIQTKTPVRVRYIHTDKMGIVYHSHYLAWFAAGRSAFFQELGTPYTEVEKKGISLPVIEAYLQYKNPAYYDQLIVVHTILKEIPKGARIKIYYKIYDEESKKVLVEGYTVHGVINKKGKPSRMPSWLRNILQEKNK